MTLAAAALAAAGLATSGLAAPPAQSEATIQRTLEAAAGGTLTVDASFGHILVRTHDGDGVEVTVERQVRERHAADRDRILGEHRVDIRQEGNGVTVDVEVPEEARDRWRDDYRGTPLQVEIAVSVPRRFDLALETAGGHIDVADIEGDIRVHTSGGHLDLGNIAGAVRGETSGGHITLLGSTATADLHTSGGHIEIGEVDGDVTAETSGGHVTVRRSGGNVRVRSSGGRIEVEEVHGSIDASTSGGSIEARISEQPGGHSSLSTSGGNVTVWLAEDIAVDLDASGSGGVDVELEIDGRVRRDAVEASINGGGPELRLRTSGGRVRVRRM